MYSSPKILKKTKIVVSSKSCKFNKSLIYFNGTEIQNSLSYKYLGSYFLLLVHFRLNKKALLNRKFHTSQISHRFKNWYQNVTFAKYEI